MYNPNSEIRLLKCALDSSYEHTKYFNTKEEQTNYFLSKTEKTFNNYNVVRDGRIRVKGNVGEFYNYNYMMFRNTNFSNKWFYAFINEVVYINENTTEIVYEIDVLQTWYFNIEWLDSYIEREHVINDDVGKHTLDENLDIGETIVVESRESEQIKELAYIIVSSVDKDGVPQSGGEYSGVFSGLSYFGSSNIEFIKQFIHELDELGKADAINCIFTMPKALMGTTDSILKLNDSNAGYFVEDGTDKYYGELDGYIPKNNKLYVYPYNYLEVTDNKGNINVYKYELFSQPICQFFITCDISPNPTVMATPAWYNGKIRDYENSITLTDYPLCAWSSDVYANWLAQNQTSNTLNILNSLMGVGVGIATGNPLGLASGVMGVANSIGNFKDMSVRPPKSMGTISGAGNIARYSQTFTFNKKTVRYEYAKLIDEFFTVYGYKVLRRGKISLKNRENYTFIKTLECNFKGDFDNVSKNKIKEIFNNGVTYWVSEIGNYDVENKPLEGGEIPSLPEIPENPGLSDEDFEKLLLECEKHIGKPYEMGGDGEDTFDCSGYTKWCFSKALEIDLPRTAQEQYNISEKIHESQRKKGDLVFFEGTYNPGDGRIVTHVGIYVGNNKMIHAGSSGVGYTDLGNSYWQEHFYSYGRVV